MADRKPLPPRDDFARYIRDRLLPELRELRITRVTADFEMVLRYLADEDRQQLQAPHQLVN